MIDQQKTRKDAVTFDKSEPLLTREELIVMVGLTLISLGLVFLLGQANILDYGSPWWTLFIGVPGLVFLGAGVLTFRHHGHMTPMAWVQVVVGLLATVLALIFLIDPTWSFTRDWTLFKGDFWNTLWPWALVALGVVAFAAGVIRREFATGLLGVLVGIVGLVFIFNISWNVVWPLAIVAVGIGMLSLLFRRA